MTWWLGSQNAYLPNVTAITINDLEKETGRRGCHHGRRHTLGKFLSEAQFSDSRYGEFLGNAQTNAQT